MKSNTLSPDFVKSMFEFDDANRKVLRKITTGPTAIKGSAIPSRQTMIGGKSYCSKAIAWCLSRGEYPAEFVFCLDGDESNLSPENLLKTLNIKSEQQLLEALETVKRLLSYNPESGEFAWLTPKKSKFGGGSAGWTHSAGYAVINIFGFKAYAHRLAFLMMSGRLPENVIDHINGNKKDNKWSNLRDVAQRTNVENRISRSTGRSGLLGVHWNSQSGMWKAEIKTHGKKKHIGFFPDKNAAHQAYLQVKREIHLGFTL